MMVSVQGNQPKEKGSQSYKTAICWTKELKGESYPTEVARFNCGGSSGFSKTQRETARTSSIFFGGKLYFSQASRCLHYFLISLFFFFFLRELCGLVIITIWMSLCRSSAK